MSSTRKQDVERQLKELITDLEKRGPLTGVGTVKASRAAAESGLIGTKLNLLVKAQDEIINSDTQLKDLLKRAQNLFKQKFTPQPLTEMKENHDEVGIEVETHQRRVSHVMFKEIDVKNNTSRIEVQPTSIVSSELGAEDCLTEETVTRNANSPKDLLVLINSTLQRYIDKAEEFLTGQKKQGDFEFKILPTRQAGQQGDVMASKEDKETLLGLLTKEDKLSEKMFFIAQYYSKDNPEKLGVFHFDKKGNLEHVRHTKDRAKAAYELLTSLKSISSVINNPAPNKRKGDAIHDISVAIETALDTIKEKEKDFKAEKRSVVSSLFKKDKPSITDIFIQHEKEKVPLESLVTAFQRSTTPPPLPTPGSPSR